jgi:hypothetical protein
MRTLAWTRGRPGRCPPPGRRGHRRVRRPQPDSQPPAARRPAARGPSGIRRGARLRSAAEVTSTTRPWNRSGSNRRSGCHGGGSGRLILGAVHQLPPHASQRWHDPTRDVTGWDSRTATRYPVIGRQVSATVVPDPLDRGTPRHQGRGTPDRCEWSESCAKRAEPPAARTRSCGSRRRCDQPSRCHGRRRSRSCRVPRRERRSCRCRPGPRPCPCRCRG